jgi:hypothetical protein
MTDDKSYDRVSVLERHMTDVLERLRALEHNANSIDDHIAALEKRQQQRNPEAATRVFAHLVQAVEDLQVEMRVLNLRIDNMQSKLLPLLRRQQQHDLEVKAKAALAPTLPVLPGWYGPETLPVRVSSDSQFSVTVIGVWHDSNGAVDVDTMFYSYYQDNWSVDTPPHSWCYIPAASPQAERYEHTVLPEGAHNE